MADIFVSYARARRDATLELLDRLWEAGYTTWTDAKLAANEQPFQQMIDAEVDGAKAVVAIWTTPAIRSKWVNYESKRALIQKKLVCTHTADVDPGHQLPGDFHGLHCPPVSDFPTIFNSLIELDCRPEGKTEADLPAEAVLERHAVREWRERVCRSQDLDELRDFIVRYERVRSVSEVARWRLRGLEQRLAAEGDAERGRVFKFFEAIEDSNDPEDFAYFLRKQFSAQPELAALAGQRLLELDADLFVQTATAIPGAGETLPDLFESAERTIRLRETPPEEAILRLDPGMHTAVIQRISVTADGRMLATASQDKTVRLWALPEGRLVRTLRPAIGAGDEGKAYAVALAPDGRWAAVGGMLGEVNKRFVTLFDTATGAVITRLGPLANVVLDLEVSPDGARLAAGLGGGEGVRVWDVTPIAAATPPLAPARGRGAGGEGGGATFALSGASSHTKTALTPSPSTLRVNPASGRGEIALIVSDTDYGDSVLGLAFARDGRLAATCLDGRIRLYPAAGGRARSAPAPGGARPYGVAFSPDGARLAVGYQDSTRVDLLDAADLSPLGEADVTGVTGGSLDSVAFLADPGSGSGTGPGSEAGTGSRLAAGGVGHASRGSPIFVWADGGRGARTAWQGPENTVMDLATLPDAGAGAPAGARLAFGASGPAFGLFTGDGARALYRGPAIADLRGKLGEHFLISADGTRLRFGLKQGGDVPVLFDLTARRLTPAPEAPATPGSGAGASLAAADTSGLTIENWINETEPSLKTGGLLGGKTVKLPLEPHETSRSLAVAPDAKSFVLGTDWALRRFDAKGAQLWEQPVPGVVWGVHLVREGRLVLAAYADGTIRWHRAADGVELLALFIHLPEGADGPPETWRWVLYTPKGYYEASSAKAESIIGWHVNRGPDQAADFYPADTFASTFKKPEMIDAALEGV